MQHQSAISKAFVNISKRENHKEMLNLDNIDFEAKKLAAMVRMRIHCFDIPKM